MSSDHYFNVRQEINNTKIKLVIDGQAKFPVYMNLSDGKYYKHDNDTFLNMFYIEEEKRGFYPKENHSVPGVFEIDLKPNETKEISFVCSFEENIEEINVSNLIKEEKRRLDKIVRKTNLIKLSNDAKYNEFIKELIFASDKFIVNRSAFGLHTIIAGYPWFLDWGRDSLIAFEGLVLKTKRYEIAREILLTTVRDIKFGLVPNGYSGFDNRPLYNSSDASMLLFEAVQKYIDYTGDYSFVRERIYGRLEEIIENYSKRIDVDDNNIFMDEDYLISTGSENTQNTWMDAKANGIAATPRNGKTVEINSLWYNSLMIIGNLTIRYKSKDEAKKYFDLAKKVKKSFNDKFYNSKKKCLFDVLEDPKIRPNQLFALSLTNPVIDPDSEKAYNIIETIEKKLLNKYGLKSLAKGEEKYTEIYEGDGFKRDMSYHQGITWVWLLGLYYNSLKNMIKYEKRITYKKKLEEKLNDLVETVLKTYEKEINDRGCIQNISEIYDSKAPYLPKGTIAQAWSVSEILRIILEK